MAVRYTRVLVRAASMVCEGKEAPEGLCDTIIDLDRAVDAPAAYIEESKYQLDTRRFTPKAAEEATTV